MVAMVVVFGGVEDSGNVFKQSRLACWRGRGGAVTMNSGEIMAMGAAPLRTAEFALNYGV